MDNELDPSRSEPRWPIHRDVERYNHLLGIDPITIFEEGGLWIEIGPGADARPMLPLIGQEDTTLAAIGPHHRSLPAAIHFTQGTVPEDQGFLAAYRGKARLVTDVYAAVSYCQDPIQAMIYGSLLLADGGLFLAFTELCRFGDLPTWERITEFFRAQLGQSIGFETMSVLGDASKAYSTCLRVRVQGRSTQTASLARIFEEAAGFIGTPVKTGTLWVAEDQSASISRVDYLRAPASSPKRSSQS